MVMKMKVTEGQAESNVSLPKSKQADCLQTQIISGLNDCITYGSIFTSLPVYGFRLAPL